MNRTILVTAVACLFVPANVASPELVRGIAIDFVTIGNPGNPGDTRPEANPTGCGAVDYVYQIGKYEVTNAQWYDFVEAAGEPTGNPSNAYDHSAYWTSDNIPTNCLSWYEAAQFCNYLTSGDKSQGAYQFSGDNSNPGDFEGIDRDSAIFTYGIVYVIPTEDEWYKAAYYTGTRYWTYANGTNVRPIQDVDSNYGWASNGQPWNVGDGTEEQNGTFDMMGNVKEWNQLLYLDLYRGIRGGSYWYLYYTALGSSMSVVTYPYNDSADYGFRVASVPEPCSLVFLSLGGLALIRRRRVG